MKKLFITAILVVSLSAFVGSAFSQVAVGSVTLKTLTLAATEYSVSLGQGVKAFSVQCRTASDVRIAFAAGGTATSYFTIKSGTTYYSPTLQSSPTIYLRTADAGAIIEVEYWK